jgi:hypothetical protein
VVKKTFLSLLGLPRIFHHLLSHPPASGAQQAIEDLEETPSNGGDADKTVMLGGAAWSMKAGKRQVFFS